MKTSTNNPMGKGIWGGWHTVSYTAASVEFKPTLRTHTHSFPIFCTTG
jgi:hypothetical protein